MLDVIREERGEFAFLLGVAVVIAWAYIQTLGYLPTSATVPQFMMYIVGVALVGILIMKGYGNRIKDKLGLSAASAGFDLGGDDSDSDTEGQMAGMYELDPVGVTKEMAWVLAYVLGVIYVGFFTVSAVFSLAYILLNETSPIKRRIPLAIGWTAIIMGMLYLLFIRFLQVSSVWRLGFLP
jgi:hypothetical protein